MLSLDPASKFTSTVPVYPPDGFTEIVSIPELPWLTVRVLGFGAGERAIVPLPEETTATFTVTLPVEAAYVESPA